MEYKNDKCEFTAFVKAGLDSKEQENIEICIEIKISINDTNYASKKHNEMQKNLQN